MPWKEYSVMEERLRFVARLLEGESIRFGLLSYILGGNYVHLRSGRWISCACVCQDFGPCRPTIICFT